MEIQFKVGDCVVYPLHGVGFIDKIEEKDIMNTKKLYYILKLSVSDMVSMIPVDKSQVLGLRAPAKEDEIGIAFKLLSEKPDDIGDDWKIRYNNNYNLIKNGSLLDLSKVVRNSYHRNKIKELSNTEKKLFEFALQLMIDEISLSSGIEKEEIEDKITRLLENSK